MRTDALLLAADSCGLRSVMEHITDDQEELQFVANGRTEPEIEGPTCTLFAAGQQASKTTRASISHAWRLYPIGDYLPTCAGSTEAEETILCSRWSGVRREAQEKRYALGAPAIATAG